MKPRIPILRAIVFAGALAACADSSSTVDGLQLKANVSAATNGMFSVQEVDYKSVLPGLDIVRVNPMLVGSSRVGDFRSTAEVTGWYWDFEMRVGLDIFNKRGVTLEHLGNSQDLKGSGDNGFFYRATFGKSNGTLVDLETDVTTHFVRRNKTNPYFQMTSRVLRDGTKIKYVYDQLKGAQNICENVRIIHEPSGASVYVHRNLLFDAQSCIPLDITLPDGRSKIVYHWTESPGPYQRLPQLSQVTYPDGTSRRYSYKNLPSITPNGLANGSNGLTSIVDEEGKLEAGFTWQIDESQYTASVTSRYKGSHETPLERVTVSGATDTARTLTDADGIGRTVRFVNWTSAKGVQFTRIAGLSHPCQWCESDAKEILYNDIGQPRRVTSQQGVVTTIERDATDLLQREVRRVVGAGTPEAKTITTVYHPKFNLPTKTVVKDAAGNVVTKEFSFNDKGFVTQATVTNTTKTVAGQSATLVRQTNIRYTFHENGQVATMNVDGPRDDANDVTVYGYHPYGLLAYTKDALGTTRYEDPNPLGYPQRIVHPNGTTTTFTYDWAGRVLARNRAGEVTRYSYYKNGLLRTESIPNVNQTTYVYDAANRLQSVTDSLGNRREYRFDGLGRPILAREGNINSQTVSRSVSLQYADLGRTVRSFPTDFPNQRTVRTYNRDFHLVKISDPMAKTVSLGVDAFGRIKSAKDNSSGLVNTLAYDVSDNVRASSYGGPEGASRRQQFQYTADATGGVWESRESDTGNDVMLRDTAGNLVDSTNTYGGNRVKNTFDAVNRVTRSEIVDPSSGATVATMNYTYDRNPLGKPAPIGLLTKISGTFGSVEYFYDKAGRVTQKRQDHGSGLYSDSYAYDQHGRLHTVTYPTGRQVHVKLDAAGRPTTMYTRASSEDDWALVADQISYTPFSDAKSMRFGGRFVATRVRDTAGRVVSYHDGTNAVTVTRRPDGLVELLSTGGRTLAKYAYDSSNRLRAASGEGFNAQQYSYESTGDLASLYNVDLGYQDNTSKLTTFGGAPLSYTQRGLVRTAGPLSLTYNALGLVATAKVENGPTYRYTYDALGRRKAKAVDGGPTTLYHYDLDGHLIVEFDAQRQEVVREYVWLGDRPVLMIVPGNGNRQESYYYIYTDYSNTPIRLIDTGGNTVWQWHRDPFGSNAPQVQKVVCNLRMPGQYFDAETGLHYNRARYYAPIAGRYLQPDPAGERGGVSAYTYADGDPVNAIDPTGLEPINLGTLPTIVVTAKGSYRSFGGFRAASYTPKNAATGNVYSYSVRDPSLAIEVYTAPTEYPFHHAAIVTDTTNLVASVIPNSNSERGHAAAEKLKTIFGLSVSASPYLRTLSAVVKVAKGVYQVGAAPFEREDITNRFLTSVDDHAVDALKQVAETAPYAGLGDITTDTAFQVVREVLNAPPGEQAFYVNGKTGEATIYHLPTGRGIVTHPCGGLHQGLRYHFAGFTSLVSRQ